MIVATYKQKFVKRRNEQMKRKRRKGKSTVKKIIAFIVSAVFYGLLVIFDIVDLVAKGSVSRDDIYIKILLYLFFFLLAILIFLFIFFLLGGEEEMWKEQNRKIKAEIKEILSETEFKEVSLQNANSERPMEMLMDILEDEGYKFYARFDSKNNEIIIICMNKRGKTVYEDAISNGFYFEKIFKVS